MSVKTEIASRLLDLDSSVKQKGKYVSQCIHFVGGVKRTFNGVLSSSIKQGQFTKFECKNGAMIMINDTNVLCIEIFEEN